MFTSVLIIDKRKELSLKYKRSIDEANINTVIALNLKDAFFMVQNLEPDMIIISDSIEENIADFCKKIRALTYNSRPIIIALSKSADTADRINVLENGADDFISEPVNIEEFKTRVKAHIRREIESNLDNKTLLPNKKYVNKALKRILSSEHHGALLVEIQNLDNYKAIYTELAADKLIQTFIAIAKSALEETGFIGQLNESTFVIITGKYSIEKFASFITFAFDTVVPKFYSENDNKRGYTILKSGESAERRINFVSILVGGIQENFEQISSSEMFINKLIDIKNLSRIPSGSNYVIERQKLTGTDSILNQMLNRDIYIHEKDESLKYLLRTTLELQGYNVQDELNKNYSSQPALIIIDSGNELENLDFCKKLKSDNNYVNTKIIVTSSVHDKTAILDSGADLYLPKPYEISELIKWTEFFLS